MKLSEKYNIEYPFQTYSFKSTQELEKKYSDIFNLMLNPKHDHELWLGNINGLLSPSSEYGLAIKLKTYILAGKKLTLVIPENYELHRPDNGRMGFRDEVWKVLRLGIKRGQVFIKTYSIENIEKNINRILKEFVEIKMKFDVVIMNPPYNKDLHLKILEKTIPIANTVINISPVRWLFDPLAEYKKNTNYKKYEESISKKIESLEIISAESALEIFSANFYNNLGIYVIGKGGYNYKIKESLINKLIKRFERHYRYKDPLPTTGMFHIVLPAIHGHAGKPDWAELTSKNYHCALSVKPNYTTHDRVIDIHFNTQVELKNYYDSLFTKFHMYCVKSLRQTASKAQFIDYLPFMQDYTLPWTNKRFCDFFNITGYISDTQAVAGSEWEEILNS